MKLSNTINKLEKTGEFKKWSIFLLQHILYSVDEYMFYCQSFIIMYILLSQCFSSPELVNQNDTEKLYINVQVSLN